ncbi:MAG: pyridoxamine 5'-phosphate oxidase family protein [Candidatus Methylomirabilales bacterium]
MARPLGNELPEALRELLDGRDPAARMGKAILITTIDPQGWPHPAMLSYGEVVAVDRRRLRLATYRASGTSRNMRRDGRLTLCLIDEGMAYYVKTRVREEQDPMAGFPALARFEATVEGVLADQAREDLEPGAGVTGGITFRLARADTEVLAEWQAVVDSLRREA